MSETISAIDACRLVMDSAGRRTTVENLLAAIFDEVRSQAIAGHYHAEFKFPDGTESCVEWDVRRELAASGYQVFTKGGFDPKAIVLGTIEICWSTPLQK